MIPDKQLLGKVRLNIGYNNLVKMSKTIFLRNKLDFSDTSSADEEFSISKNNRSF